MKTKEEWAKEVDKLLNDKVGDAVERYQAQRELEFAELVELGGQLETLEAEQKQLLDKRSGLNLLKNADLKESNLIGMRLPKLEKQLAACRKKIDALVGRLTEVSEFDLRSLNFLSAVDFSSRPTYAEMLKKERSLRKKKQGLQAECAALVHEPVKNAS